MFICSSNLWRRYILLSKIVWCFQQMSAVPWLSSLYTSKGACLTLIFSPFHFHSSCPLLIFPLPKLGLLSFCFESCLNHLYKHEMFSASCFLFLIALYLCYQSCSLNKWFYSEQFINFLTPFLQNFWQFQWASNHSVKLLFLKLAVANSISSLSVVTALNVCPQHWFSLISLL